ncbi:MAG: ferrous iron transport protein A [Dehalococcoidia bacterium]
MVMNPNEQLTLAEMRTGQTGTVVGVAGGHGFARRLDALGIRPGQRVTKLSAALFRGPIIVKVGSAQLAIGFGMARRIVVELNRHLPRAS